MKPNPEVAFAAKIEKARKLNAEMQDARLVLRAADALRIDPFFYRIVNEKHVKATEKFIRFMQKNALPIGMFN